MGRPIKEVQGPEKLPARPVLKGFAEGSSVRKPYSPPPFLSLRRRHSPAPTSNPARPSHRSVARRHAMVSRGGSDGRATRLGGGDSLPRPPVFRTDAERRKWNKSEGARKRSARRWTNWGLTPPGKLARYGNAGEGSSSDQSSRAPPPP
jgi:hypothetical protein